MYKNITLNDLILELTKLQKTHGTREIHSIGAACGTINGLSDPFCIHFDSDSTEYIPAYQHDLSNTTQPLSPTEPPSFQWILKDEHGKGVCSHCNRLDSIDPLATHCRFCGAALLSTTKPKEPTIESTPINTTRKEQ